MIMTTRPSHIASLNPNYNSNERIERHHVESYEFRRGNEKDRPFHVNGPKALLKFANISAELKIKK